MTDKQYTDIFDLFDKIWNTAQKKGVPMTLEKATKFVQHLNERKRGVAKCKIDKKK